MTYLPLSYLLGSRAKIDIVRILVNKQNYTGRKIAVLSSTNPNSNKKALDFLIETGLVRREQVGNSFHYNLNEKHFLYEPIINLFKEEEKTINKIMKFAASFIEEFAPKTLAGFVSYRKSSVELTLIAHSFPIKDLTDYIYEKTGFRVIVKVIDTISLDVNSVSNYADKVYFWNNYKSIAKIMESRNIVKTFFSF
jgi:predicted transcriptional regulator